MGNDPTSSAWKAEAQPLDQARVLADTEGFEPSGQLSPAGTLAKCCIKPLYQVSMNWCRLPRLARAVSALQERRIAINA